ncbi:NADH dehydrogenase [Methylobacterium phyllostachyos]|uniref:NADH dehydrogenase n=1 Tax=Methylobacterium phyllostachyos TaxID=582672 RepID=A0A1G9VXD3_9HYPH|nr:NAD(P)/FAD-dependent oxidoreductase [Methylobacterium phyllostachyos]SDM76763.1 NADH dehydrogenase [Methylobacterium phyllostachyos]
MSDRRHRILILGGGIAGLELATRLGRARRRNALDVTLADRNLVHIWKPMLHTFATGMARLGRQEVGFRAHAAENGYRFVPGALVALDRTAREATLAPLAGRPERVAIAYDTLVLAVGSRVNDFGTPGVARYCATIDDLADAEAFHVRFRDTLIEAHATGKPVHVAIVGGGATGVELAAEIKRAADRLSALRQGAPVTLSLIETGDRLLPHFPASISTSATRTLTALGVAVRTKTKVVSADAQSFTIEGGDRIDATLPVWAAGVKAPGVLDGLGLPHSKTGQIEVGSDLRATGDPAIFALGDCARCTDGAGHAVPATAQAAREQAIYLARHLDGALAGERVPAFRYRDRGAIVALGDYNGWGTLGRYQFGGAMRGLTARVLHALLYRRHQFEVLGVRRGLLTWIADALEGAAGSPFL